MLGGLFSKSSGKKIFLPEESASKESAQFLARIIEDLRTGQNNFESIFINMILKKEREGNRTAFYGKKRYRYRSLMECFPFFLAILKSETIFFTFRQTCDSDIGFRSWCPHFGPTPKDMNFKLFKKLLKKRRKLLWTRVFVHRFFETTITHVKSYSTHFANSLEKINNYVLRSRSRLQGKNVRGVRASSASSSGYL